MTPVEVEDRVAAAFAGRRTALARLVSLFEDPRAEAAQVRRRVLDTVDRHAAARSARIIGVTGTPGAGKSTLLSALTERMLREDADVRVAVLAIDPSSERSGGALLGDRTRFRLPTSEDRIYFRSQASDRDLGGVSRHTWQVTRLLSRFVDVLFLETVGIGQNEVEIQYAADRVFLVMTPLGGDQVQFMKAGIMEIPDAIVLNKCDAVADARRSLHALRSSLAFARPDLATAIPILQTSASLGQGIDRLRDAVLEPPGPEVDERRRGRPAYFFRKWVRDEYGRHGLRALDAEPLDVNEASFEEAQLEMGRRMAGA